MTDSHDVPSWLIPLPCATHAHEMPTEARPLGAGSAAAVWSHQRANIGMIVPYQLLTGSLQQHLLA